MEKEQDMVSESGSAAIEIGEYFFERSLKDYSALKTKLWKINHINTDDRNRWGNTK